MAARVGVELPMNPWEIKQRFNQAVCEMVTSLSLPVLLSVSLLFCLSCSIYVSGICTQSLGQFTNSIYKLSLAELIPQSFSLIFYPSQSPAVPHTCDPVFGRSIGRVILNVQGQAGNLQRGWLMDQGLFVSQLMQSNIAEKSENIQLHFHSVTDCR